MSASGHNRTSARAVGNVGFGPEGDIAHAQRDWIGWYCFDFRNFLRSQES